MDCKCFIGFSFQVSTAGLMKWNGEPYLRPADGKLDHRERRLIRRRGKSAGKNPVTGLPVSQGRGVHRPSPQRGRFAAGGLPPFAAFILQRLRINGRANLVDDADNLGNRRGILTLNSCGFPPQGY